MSAISLPQGSPPEDTVVSESPLSTIADFPAELRLLGMECSLGTTSIDALERVALQVTREQVGRWFARFQETQEAGLLITCHRVELVLLLTSDEELQRWLAVLPGPPNSWRKREGRPLVGHLFSVAGGRESLARGEGEVRAQVEVAGRRVETRHPRRVLRELFARAVAAAEEGSASGSSPPSIAAIAAAKVLALANDTRPRVLVIGSGKVGCQVAERLGAAARVTLLFHRNPPDAAVLTALGARAEPLHRLASELLTADVAVSAAKFGARGLKASDIPAGRSLLLIDLGMPRNIDPDVRELPHVRLLDLENLYATTRSGTPTTARDRHLRGRAEQCYDRLEALLMEPWVGALRRAAEQLRQSEVLKARRFLGTLDPAQERAIDRLTQRLIAQLLLFPTEQIRSLPSGPDGTVRRQWALQLWRPPRPGPCPS